MLCVHARERLRTHWDSRLAGTKLWLCPTGSQTPMRKQESRRGGQDHDPTYVAARTIVELIQQRSTATASGFVFSWSTITRIRNRRLELETLPSSRAVPRSSQQQLYFWRSNEMRKQRCPDPPQLRVPFCASPAILLRLPAPGRRDTGGFRVGACWLRQFHGPPLGPPQANPQGQEQDWRTAGLAWDQSTIHRGCCCGCGCPRPGSSLFAVIRPFNTLGRRLPWHTTHEYWRMTSAST